MAAQAAVPTSHITGEYELAYGASSTPHMPKELPKESSDSLPGAVQTGGFNIRGLTWDEPIYPLYADGIAAEIRVVIQLFPEQIDQRTKTALLAMAKKIEGLHKECPPIRKLRRGEHSQASIRAKAPIATALDPDPGRGDEGNPRLYSLERTVRLALMLHTAGYTTLTKKQIVDAAMFTHRFRYADKHGEHDPYGWASETYRKISDRFLRYIENQDWRGLAAATNDYLKTTRKADDPYYPSIAKFNAIAEALAARSWRTERNNWEPPQLFPVGDGEFERDGEVRTILTIPEIDPRLPATSSNAQKALAVRGSSMRLTCLWGDMSQEALHPIEAQHCMRWLLSRQPQHEAEEIALLLWILVGMTMHRFDNLLMGLCGPIPGKTANPELRVTIEGSRITISLDVIPGINFDAVPESSQFYFAETSNRVSFQVDTHTSRLDPACLMKLARASYEGDRLVQDVLIEKDRIQLAIRKECDVFTDNHFRGGLYQAIFTETHDIALLQLMTGELLGFSDASLHYAAFSPAQIQSALNAGLSRQYDSMLTPIPVEEETGLLIGAPTSAFYIEAIRSATIGLRMELDATDENLTTKELWMETHNTLTDYIGWMLLNTFGSRNLADLPAMTLKQLSLTLGCAVLYEKGSDPSIFRRVAVLPKFSIGEIYRLIDHLRKLATQFGRSNSAAYQAMRQHCLDILNGGQPFLQKLAEGDDSELQFLPWSGRTLVRELFTPDVAADTCRHVMSSRMRGKCPAPLVEAQLGHGIGYDLYDRSSIVDIPTLVESLQGPLTDHLVNCGFVVEAVYSPPPTLEYSGHRVDEWHTFQSSLSAIYAEDAQRIRNMRASPPSQVEKSSAQGAIDRVLCEFCSVDDISRLPAKQALSKDECKIIYRNTLGRVSGGVKSLREAAKAVKVRLKQLRDSHQWTVDLPPQLFWDIRQPPAVTHIHLQAYESLLALRIALSKESKPAQKELLMSYFGLHIMIHGGAGSSWEEVYEVLMCADQACASPEMNALIVPIQKPVEESRSLSGLSMMALLGWLHHNRPTVSVEQFQAGIAQILPSAWRGDGPKTARLVEQLVQLARAIEIPPVFAQVESQKLAARALKAQRLVEYLANAGCNSLVDDSIIDSPPDEPLELTSKLKDSRHYREHLGILRNKIKNPLSLKELREAGYVVRNYKRERARASISHYLNQETPPQLIQLIALWSRQLLGPHANLNTGGPLKESTVLDYINEINHLLRPAMQHVNILNLDPEELYELILPRLSEDDDSRDKESFLLNRLFREVSMVADLPRLTFPTHSNDDNYSARKSIDADVVTLPENRYARSVLEKWSRSPSVMTSATFPLREAVGLLDLSQKIGTRRSEAKYLRHKDSAVYGNRLILKIRPSRRRSLKSKAARRRFVFPADQIPAALESSAESEPGDLVFSNMNARGLGFDPLQAVSTALKIATGDPASRLHRVRRTKVCDSFPEILATTNAIDRISMSCTLTGSIGHASLLSTVTNYASTVYHLIGTVYTDRIRDYPYKYLEALSSMTIPLLAQVVHKYDNPKVLRAILKSAGFAKPQLRYRKTDSRIPRKLQPQGIDYPATVLLLYRLFTRKNTLQALSANVTNATFQALPKVIDELQDRTGILILDFEKSYLMNALFESQDITISDAREQSRSQISEPCFQAWIKHLRQVPNSKVLHSLAALRPFTQYHVTRTRVCLRASPSQSPEEFSAALAVLGLPLRLVEKTDSLWQITLTQCVDSHIRLQTIKALILSVLTITEIGNLTD